MSLARGNVPKSKPLSSRFFVEYFHVSSEMFCSTIVFCVDFSFYVVESSLWFDR